MDGDDAAAALLELVRAAGRRPPTAATEPAIALLRCCAAAAPAAAGISGTSSHFAEVAALLGSEDARVGEVAAQLLDGAGATAHVEAAGDVAHAFDALSGDAAAQRAFLGAAAGREFEDPFLHAALGGVADTTGEPGLTLAAIKGYFDGPPSAHDATKRQLLLAALRAALAARRRRRGADAAAIAVKCRRMAEATSEDGDEDAEAAAFSLATAYLEDLGRDL